jgi:hypothetical protein
MKKKLISALATKFEGVDAKVFDRIADNILDRKTIESDDDVEAAVAEITIQDVLKSYGDARATESARTAKRNAIKEYERRYKLKDGKRVAQKDDDDDPDPDPDDDSDDKDPTGVLAAMKKMFGALEKKLDDANSEIAAMKLGKVTETRKAKVNELIKDLTEAERRPYSRILVDSMTDEEFNAYLEEVKADAQNIAEEKAANGASFLPPLGGKTGGGQPKEPSDAEVEEVLSKMNL